MPRRVGPTAMAGRTSSERRGFTLIELLMVLVIISILAAVAQPNLHRALVKARAADVIADLNVVKVAVMNYQGDYHRWPADRSRGVIPPGLATYLPTGSTFKTADYTLDYDNWSAKKNPAFDIGLTYISTDVELGLAVLDMLGTNVWSDGVSKFTWIIEG